ncbi:E3 ubiquitin-protein ligase MIB2-like isoform X2 [Octopus sinensis]|uniref:E3 ubiquitin-protein ligase MIB2-like isoform X2 n=1 Tax=Octopus sinensis TaxID=2607531 RepID=A0A7E6EGU4_9MOLL|nr:E3 ubiquitin-protein ligase MIB2-like isoform X2 [Octopus sinensis]
MDSIYNKIRNNDVEGLKILLQEKPLEINKPINEYGRTPLMFACRVGANRRIFEILIEAGAELGAKDYRGGTAIHYAVLWDRHQAVEILLSRGCDVNPRDVDGQTPLHCACSSGCFHTVELLLSHNGIDVNVIDKEGDTPLHVAVQQRKYKVVCAMLSKGSVQFDIKNKKEMTPLLEAVSRGHLGMTHLLIALGASINAVDGEGNSCLHLAVEREVFDSEGAPLDLLNECCTSLNLKIEERLSGIVVARYLASQGADFHHKNNKNNTPLDLIKDPNLRKKLEAFSPPQCVFCEDEVATETFFPCKHLSLCKKCCPQKIPKRCLKCGQKITRKNSLEGPKSSKPEVQMLTEPPVNRTFEVKETQTLAEPVVRPKFKGKASQRVVEPVEHSTASIVPGASTDSGLQSSSGVDESEEGYYGRDFAKRTQLSSKQYEHSTGSMVSGASTDSGFKSYSGVDQSENDWFPKSQNKQVNRFT